MCLSYIYLKLSQKNKTTAGKPQKVPEHSQIPCFLPVGSHSSGCASLGPHVLCSARCGPEVDDQPKARVCRKNRSQASMPQRTR